MSDFVNDVCSRKHVYVAPVVQVARIDAQMLLANSFTDANDPMGTGEDIPWESSVSGLFDLYE